MTIRDKARGGPGSRGAGGRSRTCRAVLGWALALPLLASGCSAIPDWADPSDLFEPDQPPTRLSSAEAATQAQAEATFPNLASVPDAPRSATPAATRAQIREGLAADRANAQYSGERLVGQTSGAAPASAPPAPAIARDLGVAAAQPAQVQRAQVAPVVQPLAAASTPPAAASTPPAPNRQLRFAQFQGDAQPPPVARTGQSELVGIIYFAHGAASLDQEDRAVLRDIAALHRQRGGSIRIIGHASARTGTVDPIRHRTANLEISQQRANAAVAGLVALGVEQARIRAEARADAQPVYHEFMPTGEAGNRRAEIFLEY